MATIVISTNIQNDKTRAGEWDMQDRARRTIVWL